MCRKSIAVQRACLLLICSVAAAVVLPLGCAEDVTLPRRDPIPPSAVTDLTATSASTTSIRLTWTAPGDNGELGTASQYDIRYSLNPIDSLNWDSVTMCVGEPAPGDPGQTATFTVPGLTYGTTYYFALKTADGVPNWSDLSNVATQKTCGGSCEYVEYPGSAFITSIVQDTRQTRLCENGVVITFNFIPADLSAPDRYLIPTWPDVNRIFTVGDGASPPLNWATSQGLMVGSEHECVRREIVCGTCTPVIFKFPDIDYSHWADSCDFGRY
jgi:hypothetical protein